MTKAERAEKYFRDAVSAASAYISEAKSTFGVDMKKLEYYDLAANAIRRAAEDDKARDEGHVAMQFAMGDTVWVVERDEDSEPCEVSGYVLLTEVAGYAFVSPTANGSSDVEDILTDAVKSTAWSYHADFGVYPISDCYLTRQEAEAALEGGGEGG